MSPYVPKEIPEAVNVNVTQVHPLANLVYLFATVAIVGSAIYGLLGVAASQLATQIGPKTEENIGAAMTAAFPTRTAAEDSRVTYLERLLASLEADVRKTDLGNGQYPPLKVRTLEAPEENAMVTAGSYLLVTDGLLAAVESENELAFVLAHELGHLHNRDPLKALGRSLVLITLSSIVSNSALVNVVNASELSYNRSQETAADNYASELIQARYRHMGDSLGFFERNREPALGAFGIIAEWQQTHPLSSSRIQRLEDKFEQRGWPENGKITPLPDNIRCVNFQDCN